MNWLHYVFRRKCGYHEIIRLLYKIMSKITDYTASVDAFLARQEAAIAGIADDVASLKAKIDEIQNSPGTLSPSDQEALDASQALIEAATVKLETLDNLTAPSAPSP